MASITERECLRAAAGAPPVVASFEIEGLGLFYIIFGIFHLAIVAGIGALVKVKQPPDRSMATSDLAQTG
ncbi:MAG: hypothetical protein R3F19_10720 [Verrucomicrobiales bacterium]